MSPSSVEPIRKEFVVQASQEKCFRTFTESIDAWWPRQHHIGSSPLRTEVLEPRLGGRWYAVSEDGSVCQIGKVLAWDTFGRLVLSWQITAEWKFDPDFVTEIEVQFIPEGPKATRFKMEHRNLERFGTTAEGLRGEMDPGWGGSMEAFKRFVEAQERA